MIEFKCKRCGAAMEAPDSLAGQPEKCPECKKVNRIPTLGVTTISQLSASVITAKPTRRRKLLIVLGVVAVLAVGGYFAAVHFGPEHWRINAQGKAAYAALDELNTSIQTPIGRDEYCQCVRRASLKVKPYMESQNAKSCPKFSEWIGKTMVCYAAAAENWSKGTTVLGEIDRGLARDVMVHRQEMVQLKWLIASHCLMNAKCIIEGTPEKIRPLTQDEMDEMSGKRRERE